MAKKSRAERVRLAVRKFRLAPEQVEAALGRIDAQMEERKRQKDATLAMTKEEKDRVRMLGIAASKTLQYAASDKLPVALRALIGASEIPEMLKEMMRACKHLSNQKQKPKRDDGFEKRLAAEEAVLLLPSGSQSLKHWNELAAILYGTGDPADVHRACRTLRENLPADLALRKKRLTELKTQVAALEVELAEKGSKEQKATTGKTEG
jgi:hypothetical protein